MQSQPSWIFRALGWIHRELGIATIASAPSDTYFLLASRFVRMFAYGSSTLILALYLSALSHSDTKIGLFMSLTLLGDVVISLFLTSCADAFHGGMQDHVGNDARAVRVADVLAKARRNLGKETTRHKAARLAVADE